VEINLPITFPVHLAIDLVTLLPLLVMMQFFFLIGDNVVVVARLATEGVGEKAFKLCNLYSCRDNYRYWTGYYGLPVAGWNAGNDGKNYYNDKA